MIYIIFYFLSITILIKLFSKNLRVFKSLDNYLSSLKNIKNINFNNKNNKHVLETIQKDGGILIIKLIIICIPYISLYYSLGFIDGNQYLKLLISAAPYIVLLFS